MEFRQQYSTVHSVRHLWSYLAFPTIFGNGGHLWPQAVGMEGPIADITEQVPVILVGLPANQKSCCNLTNFFSQFSESCTPILTWSFSLYLVKCVSNQTGKLRYKKIYLTEPINIYYIWPNHTSELKKGETNKLVRIRGSYVLFDSIPPTQLSCKKFHNSAKTK